MTTKTFELYNLTEANSKLKTIRQDAYKALAARDAIESCCSPEWAEAHQVAADLFLEAEELVKQLAADPATRYGSWRTPGDKTCMTFGLL